MNTIYSDDPKENEVTVKRSSVSIASLFILWDIVAVAACFITSILGYDPTIIVEITKSSIVATFLLILLED